MFSHALYNVVHIIGIAFLMAAMGGIAATARPGAVNPAARRTIVVFHLLGGFLILLGGFGMLARLGIVQGSSWPLWIWVKVGVWGVLGLAAFLPYRFPRAALPLLLLVPVLAGLAAYMAIYKPI